MSNWISEPAISILMQLKRQKLTVDITNIAKIRALCTTPQD
jgi:hypothetical protein